jgi:hypothetical protein
MHPIPDKAEVAVDFPDKLYIGGFGRDSAFEVRSEPDGVLVRLLRAGPDRREVKIYLHHLLLTDILCDLAETVIRGTIDDTHRKPLLDAARRLVAALDVDSTGS